MNFDEVMALSDEELQIRVAMLQGAARTEKRNGCLQQYRFEDDMGFGPVWQPIPDYPNDIAAAWELAEKARLSVICVDCASGQDEDIWGAGKGDIDGLLEEFYAPWSLMTAKTAARAITRAFVWVRTQGAT